MLPPSDLHQSTIGQLQSLLDARGLSAVELTRAFLERIAAMNEQGPRLRAVLQVNPQAEEIAEALDRERRERGPRGPLHGIPILLKDNIDTGDQQETTAGSLALLGTRPARDASVAARLRDAGAILLGKANMSEWANFRSRHSSSGWSGRGGQVLNPYVLDRTPCGSSSGSATAVAAALAPASLGTETAGSILCPAAANSVVGIKPTVGLTSRAGVIPISHTQDTVGAFGRTVADAAIVLGAIAGVDRSDPATQTISLVTDYERYLETESLGGVRIGVPRAHLFGYNAEADACTETAIAALAALGAEIVDPADIPSIDQITEGDAMMQILLYEFKANLDAYLAGRPGAEIDSLAALIRFNEQHEAEEMPYFGQDIFIGSADKGPLTDPTYRQALAMSRRLSRDEGLDAVLRGFRLHALIAPTTGPPWVIDLEHGDANSGGSAGVPAMAGYPAISLPAGYARELPIGVTLFGRAFSEPTLIRIASALETAMQVWRPPRYLTSVGSD